MNQSKYENENKNSLLKLSNSLETGVSSDHFRDFATSLKKYFPSDSLLVASSLYTNPFHTQNMKDFQQIPI